MCSPGGLDTSAAFRDSDYEYPIDFDALVETMDFAPPTRPSARKPAVRRTRVDNMLQAAVLCGDPEGTRAALAAGANPNQIAEPVAAASRIDTDDGCLIPMLDPVHVPENASLLACVAGAGFTVTVRALLADPRIDPQLGDVHPLLAAAGGGHAEIVDALLALPATDPAAAVDLTETPLTAAITSGSMSTVAALLADPRTDVNVTVVKDIMGQYVWSNKDPTSHRRFAARVLHTTEYTEISPLCLAVARRNVPAVTALLDHPLIEPFRGTVSPFKAATAFQFGDVVAVMRLYGARTA